jgi:hypothetical protein
MSSRSAPPPLTFKLQPAAEGTVWSPAAPESKSASLLKPFKEWWSSPPPVEIESESDPVSVAVFAPASTVPV